MWMRFFRGTKSLCLVAGGMLLSAVFLEAQTSIEIANPSFELPGVGKIKGWDGPGSCADPGWAGATEDIPGWEADTPVWDSGVETGWGPTDGEYTGFIMGQDTSVYQITDYVIQANDQIVLSVDAKNNWQATFFLMMLFYEENGARIPLDAEEWEITNTMETYEIGFSANERPEAVGRHLGILFDNTSEMGQSWIGFDHVRLVNTATGVRRGGTIPTAHTLLQNYPNPFNPVTTVWFSLNRNGWVRLSVVDAAGSEVAVLFEGESQVGDHKVRFDAKDLPSGLYLCRLEGTVSATHKMLLLK